MTGFSDTQGDDYERWAMSAEQWENPKRRTSNFEQKNKLMKKYSYMK
jgi:hypothetical protein